MSSLVRWPGLLGLLGYFIVALGTCQLLPLVVALIEADEGRVPFLLSIGVSALLGVPLIQLFRRSKTEFHQREGILLVLLTWVTAGILGALPFFFSSYFPSFTDAVFESTSGFTTTGATILSEIESLPRSLLLWRSFTHWLGGMGIILLGIAILPLIGTGGMELYRAEFSGAVSEKLKPRIAETAFALWRVYAGFTVASFLAFAGLGMNAFDALCHSFATLGTGGFSTKNASIESFESPALEIAIIVFMFLAGINFTQHYRLLVQKRPTDFFRDREIRSYTALTIVASVALTVPLVVVSQEGILDAIRLSTFQVVSILTTTGFSTANFEAWTPFAQLVLLALMFSGGCTGSTAGGLKVARIDLLFRVIFREFRRMVERRGVFAIHVGGRTIPETTIQSLLNLVYFAFLINFGACMVLTMFGVDVLTSISAVAASMFNIGPGLAAVGPYDNYGHFPATVKWVLSLCMIAGRLEFYAVFVVLTPIFWKK